MDQKATEAAGYDKGLECGLKQGIEQGIEQGIASNKIETAKKLKANGVDINIIHDATGLSIDEINNL